MPRGRKKLELTPEQKFEIDEGQYQAANRDYEATIEPCPHCGGRLGYNPVTGVELKKGHFASCITQQDKRAMVTTYNTSL